VVDPESAESAPALEAVPEPKVILTTGSPRLCASASWNENRVNRKQAIRAISLPGFKVNNIYKHN
jgi:hypothetical protein